MQITMLPSRKETDGLTEDFVKLQTQVKQNEINMVSKEAWASLK